MAKISESACRVFGSHKLSCGTTHGGPAGTPSIVPHSAENRQACGWLVEAKGGRSALERFLGNCGAGSATSERPVSAAFRFHAPIDFALLLPTTRPFFYLHPNKPSLPNSCLLLL
jgi:hypothetical protein